MAQVLLVHGINNTFGGPEVMAAGWVPALLSGVRLAGGGGVLRSEDVAAVFYGDLFRRPGRFLAGGDEEVTTLEAGDVPDGVEAELLLAWWREAARIDSAVVPPDAHTLGATDAVQAALAALAGSRLLAGATERLLIWLLRQVRAYFTDTSVRQRVQGRFAEMVDADTQVVVAHSLGSVVAYEALCANSGWPVTGLVTVGSPLAVRNVVFDRLIPPPVRKEGGRQAVWPDGLASWTNVADRRDFVALVKRLQPVFGNTVVDVEVDNGWRVHDVGRYLTARETGAAVMAALGGGKGDAGG